MTSPPPSDPGLPDAELLRLDHQVCFSLQAASRAFGGVYRDALKELGLTYPQYLAMMVLWEHGPLPVKTIGERLHLDSGTLSPLLKRLESAGLVRRERSPEDERSVIVHLTEAGTGLRERALSVPRTILGATGLSVQEVLALQETLARLTDSLSLAGRTG
ncbi:MarR family transcriptional regulator [Streptomyces clavifer]|uniref:MarR family winged helix-turn-helix transcriptional regulator n=1 Tax=Streptomyces TaxID=1883 RepID=UPI0006FEF5E4|nr:MULTISPECIES: MarR family transcriptional regulator [unclassified Streptomyces]KQZ19926.1 MarR family transcriptional regulator [Streptomyces sp. Root55]MDX3066360.1 MarR family transcriptional regulator [Streptomyces sp. ND04-05B]